MATEFTELPENFGHGAAHLNTQLRPQLIEIQEAINALEDAEGSTVDGSDFALPASAYSELGYPSVPLQTAVDHLYSPLEAFDQAVAYNSINVTSAGGNAHYVEAADTFTVGGITITFVDGTAGADEVDIGLDIGPLTQAIADAIQANAGYEGEAWTISVNGVNTLEIYAENYGAAGNSIPVGWTTAAATVFYSGFEGGSPESGSGPYLGEDFLRNGRDFEIDATNTTFETTTTDTVVADAGSVREAIDALATNAATLSVAVGDQKVSDDFFRFVDGGADVYDGAVSYTRSGTASAGSLTHINGWVTAAGALGDVSGGIQLAAGNAENHTLVTTAATLDNNPNGNWDWTIRAILEAAGDGAIARIGLILTGGTFTANDTGVWFQNANDTYTANIGRATAEGDSFGFEVANAAHFMWLKVSFDATAKTATVYSSVDGSTWASVQALGPLTGDMTGSLYLTMYAEGDADTTAAVYVDYWSIEPTAVRPGVAVTLPS